MAEQKTEKKSSGSKSVKRGDLVQIIRATDDEGKPTHTQLAIVTDHSKVAGDDVYAIYELPANSLSDVRIGKEIGNIQALDTKPVEGKNQPENSEPGAPTA